MTFKTTIYAAVAGLAFCSSCDSDPDPKPAGPVGGMPITVSVSEAGAPSYPLRDAVIVNANYQTGSSSMTVNGKLNNGKTLLLNFVRTGNPPAYSTDGLEATLDGTAGTAATGTTTANIQNYTVSGSFRVTFPGQGEVTGSFTGQQRP